MPGCNTRQLTNISCSAGKPLRIKLAARFGIGCLSDNVPILQRHFEAETPDVMASLAEPIPCRLVTVDKEEIERVLASTLIIKEFALRWKLGGDAPEALVFVDKQSDSIADEIEDAIAAQLPGYCVPKLHRLSRPLSTRVEEFNFEDLKKEVALEQAAALSEQGKLVAEIVAGLLHIDSGIISGSSDFFILGGNSLLLGQLSYNIRKQIGVNIGIPALFRNSTIQGIASLIDKATEHTHSNILPANVLSPLGSEVTLQGVGDFHPVRARNQTHPLCLIIQAIPFLFFYPTKASLSCAY